VAVLDCTPSEFILRFVERFNAGDLEGLAGLYEPAAVYFPRPGTKLVGTEIRQAFGNTIGRGAHMLGRCVRCVEVADLALVANRWELQRSEPRGLATLGAGVSAVVLRRAPDRGWRIVIDDPWAEDRYTRASRAGDDHVLGIL
jgi:ketosteroid isomerase-like protein